MEFPKSLLPIYIIINVVALILIPLALNKPKISRAVFVIAFLAIAGILLFFGISHPQKLVDFFAKKVVDGVDTFITGPFAENTFTFMLAASVYLVIAAGFLSFRVPFVRVGVIMGLLFFIGILLFGIGSFFPAPLFGAVALLFTIGVNYKRPVWYIPPKELRKEIRQRKRSRA
jgi:hypothetical protein